MWVFTPGDPGQGCHSSDALGDAGDAHQRAQCPEACLSRVHPQEYMLGCTELLGKRAHTPPPAAQGRQELAPSLPGPAPLQAES